MLFATINLSTNSYVVKSASDYEGRIKPSDSHIVKAIKEIKKIKFVSTNKANVSRLIEITDLILPHFKFKGLESLNQLDDLHEITSQYESKFNHGSALVDDDYKDKSVEFLKEKRARLADSISLFNTEISNFVKEKILEEENKKKKKKTAILLAIPLLGLQWGYLRSPLVMVISILTCWTIIVPLFNLVHLIQLALMSEQAFDEKHNKSLTFYRQFSVS